MYYNPSLFFSIVHADLSSKNVSYAYRDDFKPKRNC